MTTNQRLTFTGRLCQTLLKGSAGALQQTAGTTGSDCFVLIYWVISVLFEKNPLFENKYFKKFGWGWKLGCSSIPVKL